MPAVSFPAVGLVLPVQSSIRRTYALRRKFVRYQTGQLSQTSASASTSSTTGATPSLPHFITHAQAQARAQARQVWFPTWTRSTFFHPVPFFYHPILPSHFIIPSF